MAVASSEASAAVSSAENSQPDFLKRAAEFSEKLEASLLELKIKRELCESSGKLDEEIVALKLKHKEEMEEVKRSYEAKITENENRITQLTQDLQSVTEKLNSKTDCQPVTSAMKQQLCALVQQVAHLTADKTKMAERCSKLESDLKAVNARVESESAVAADVGAKFLATNEMLAKISAQMDDTSKAAAFWEDERNHWKQLAEESYADSALANAEVRRLQAELSVFQSMPPKRYGKLNSDDGEMAAGVEPSRDELSDQLRALKDRCRLLEERVARGDQMIRGYEDAKFRQEKLMDFNRKHMLKDGQIIKQQEAFIAELKKRLPDPVEEEAPQASEEEDHSKQEKIAGSTKQEQSNENVVPPTSTENEPIIEAAISMDEDA